ncbi:MAG: class I SAM-dependent methyltransferase [Myxococcaceae bacterium]
MRPTFLAACPVCGESARREVVAFPELVYGRCDGCGLIYKTEQIRELPNQYEEHYFRHNRAKYLERWEHRVRKCMRQILACLEYAPHARTLLDVGCSAGYVLEAAKRLGLRECGLDSSRFATDLCAQRGYNVALGSLTKMPFADASFDIVTLKHTLEHVAQPLEGLREVARVPKPGGVALVVVPDAAYFKLALLPRRGRSFRPDRRGWQHHVYFFDKNLQDACARVGLVTQATNKAVFRRHLAQGARTPYEYGRWVFLQGWTAVGRATRFRRELFHVVQKPDGTVADESGSSSA